MNPLKKAAKNAAFTISAVAGVIVLAVAVHDALYELNPRYAQWVDDSELFRESYS